MADTDAEVSDISMKATKQRKHTHSDSIKCPFAHKPRPCKKQQEII